MAKYGSIGILVFNHSCGYALGGLANWRFDAYDQTSADYDFLYIAIISNSCGLRKF